MIKEINGFKRGDSVYVNPEECYFSYTQFIKRHPKYMLKWSYRSFPKENKIYVIDGFYRHTLNNKYDKNSFVVVVKDGLNGQTFLVGELGLL